MTKRLDPDIKGLNACVRGMEMTSDRMRKATLEFLWDKYVVAPLRKKATDKEENP